MIIKKPYAFIIKHFRLIHLLMLACLVFMIITSGDIGDLFKSLQATSTYTYAGADVYINKSVYYILLGMLFLAGVVFWLLKEKKKPTKLYLIILVYGLACIVSYAFLFHLLTIVQSEVLESDQIILGKDLANVISLPAYPLAVICFIRGIGFNIKQFNFSKDVEELQIVDKDSAEFEVLIGQNNYKYLRFARRVIRETKYYILENKFAIKCFCCGLGLFLACYGVYYYNSYLKSLKASESTSVNGISYTVRESYITAKDYNGNVVSKGYKYVVILMSFYNSNEEKVALDMTKISLANSSLIYYPTLTKNSKFYDIGVPYKDGEYINPGETLDATLTFQIPESVTSRNFKLRVQYAINDTNTKVLTKYKTFGVSAKNLDSDLVQEQKGINQTINTDPVSKNSYSLTVTSYNLMDSYNYKYVLCKTMESCTPLSKVIVPEDRITDTMLVLKFNNQLSDDNTFAKTFNTTNKIFENYCTIIYSLYNKSYQLPVDVVNGSDVDDRVFINVDRKILNASTIKLVFKFRNEEYIVPLK